MEWKLDGCDDEVGCAYYCPYCNASFNEDWFYIHGEYKPFRYCPECGEEIKI